MRIRSILFVCLGIFTLFASDSSAQTGRTASALLKPNVIFILADDLGYGDLGVYGQRLIQTPNLDRMASEGMRFTQFYAGATVCAPSRSVLMTGKHTGRTTVRGNAGGENIHIQSLRSTDKTVAEVFKDAGYATSLFGKWGLGEIGSDGHPNKKGFDEFFGYLNQRHAHNYYPSFLIHNSEKFPLRNVPEKEDPGGWGWAKEKIDYSHDVIMDRAMNWLADNRNKPIFMYLALTIPHANNEGSQGTGNGQEVPDYGIYKDKPWSDSDKGQAAMISRMDSDIGKLMGRLKECGIDENTLVIFSSDNGPHQEGRNNPELFDANGPLRGMKRALYEGGIRVPMIARWPGRVRAMTVSDYIGYSGDFFATACELTGQKIPAGLDSISFLPTLLGKFREQQKHKYLYWEFYEQGGRQAVRFGNWKAIRQPMFTGRVQLYDLSTDIGEMNDLADNKPEIISEAVKMMNEAHVRDPNWKVSGQAPGVSPSTMAYGKLKTRWSKDVSAELPHPEYPRPQMVRANWINLNGPWSYSITQSNDVVPGQWAGNILVPFPIESQLSGVQLRVTDEQRLWYRRGFERPRLKPNERLLLNFGAVDWHAIVYVNGKLVGEHKGGYDPFSFDITAALSDDKQQTITVSVWDRTDKANYPRGKQKNQPGGIFYTPVTGIWQTVWMETVNASRIDRIKIVPDIDSRAVDIEINATSSTPLRAHVSVLSDGKVISEKIVALQDGRGRAFLSVVNPRLWSPEDPYLYDLKVSLLANNKTVDEVASYFGMRKTSLMKDARGIVRMALNNKPYFQCGPLDQGWWPDGLYTAPTDEALKYDIEMTRRLGFNLARKHVKVEPARWYYWADKLGLLVWQDMPNGGGGISVTDSKDLEYTAEETAQFKTELKSMIDALHNHPSIIVWVAFNEGWGQHNTNEILKWINNYDPSRLIDGPSGWTDRGYGDLYDIHRYPGPAMFPTQPDRATVLSEFGGLGLIVQNHLWIEDRNWGYQQFDTTEKLRARYRELIDELKVLVQNGLSAAIYTQTTDVEVEVNGLMTYDRAVVKFDESEMMRLHSELYIPATKAFYPRLILSTSETNPVTWRYTTDDPGADWFKPAFNDAGWKIGNGPIGDPDGGTYRITTPIKANRAWFRRTFSLQDTDFSNLMLRIQANDSVTVYLNGVRVRQEGGHSPDYRLSYLGPEAARALKKGENVIAVTVQRQRHPVFMDVGLIDMTPVEK